LTNTWKKKREAEPCLDLLGNARKVGVLGTTAEHKVTGAASLKIDLNGFPRGTKTQTDMTVFFKEMQLNRGPAATLGHEQRVGLL
jgi:hypothetical protein